MKKLTIWFALAALLIALNPASLKAEKIIDPAEPALITTAETSQATLSIPEAELAMVSSSAETAYANALVERLNEINEMDMSSMSSSEKRELRNEVKAIEKQQNSNGVYISVGAAILIVLLLILLL